MTHGYSQRGQVAILVVLLVPLLAILLALVANTALVVMTKLRLQITADRAAQAAGESLAATMNQLAADNWAIHAEYRANERRFAADQQRNEAEGLQHLAESQARIDVVRERMDAAVRDGYARACAAAQAVVSMEAPWAALLPLSGDVRVIAGGAAAECEAGAPLFSFGGDRVVDAQWGTQHFTFPEGGATFFDPETVDHGSGELLRYRLKPSGARQQVAFGLRLRSPLPRPVLGAVFSEGSVTMELQASAAAQPVGGSIEDFAFIDAGNVEAATRRADETDQLYRATLVPLDTLQDVEAGYQGLRYYEPRDGEWIEDEDAYLQ